ncbi:DUF4760 domain-containing protein [Polaromonas sp. AET17H-212]|uniref:DUF4760 domain-containing protein n=1 Tax=Polaromonas sp. AET17H-212 TaxID=1977061 RepID=UPI000BBBF660|nr:DUF4760 domain-containing protein [Polaromonas sp. AET17H-212]
MATHKALRPSKKPSTLLGFLLFGVLVMFGVFCLWQMYLVPNDVAYNLGPSQWVVMFAAIAAICGWIIAAVVTIRNSVKQHTINTLLQSRLSATYMGYADKISAHYEAYDERRRLNPDLVEAPTDGVDKLALRYILNYFEFIAIGIRRADLDEGLLKDSLRSILKKNVAMSRLWIEEVREVNPLLYQNLAELHRRWCFDDTPLKDRSAPPVVMSPYERLVEWYNEV